MSEKEIERVKGGGKDLKTLSNGSDCWKGSDLSRPTVVVKI